MAFSAVMAFQLEANYEWAKLRLEFRQHADAGLFINGIRRDHAASSDANITLNLSSPVQTGYEQHEFIEAFVQYEDGSIHAGIASGGHILVEQTYDR
jgi:hypothetical protein